MADANNPQAGSPSSLENSISTVTPNNGGLGIFRPAQILRDENNFDAYSRLTSKNFGHIRRVDGIRKKELVEANAALIEAKKERQNKLYEIDVLVEQLERSGWQALDFDKKIGDLKDLKKMVDVAVSLDDFSNLDKKLEEIATWAETELEEIEKLRLDDAIEKKLYKGVRRRLFELLNSRVSKLQSTPSYQKIKDLLSGLAWLQVDTKCDEYTGDPSEVEAGLTEIEALIEKEEGDITRKQRQLERAATIATTNFSNKKLEALSLLANSTTATEKDSTEMLISEIGNLQAGLSSDTVTQTEIDTFNQKLTELDAKITHLKGLVGLYSSEQTERIRQAGQLTATFEQKKQKVEFLLLNPINAGERAATQAFVESVEAISVTLKNSNNISADEVDMFSRKIAELENKLVELQTKVDAEKSRQESMFSWHAEWPKEIKYVEAKKTTSKGGVVATEQGGWKKDGRKLENQALWGKLNTQAKRVFEKYNPLVDKALSLGKESEFKDLVAIKESIIAALYDSKPEDALKDLARLEKEVATRGPAIENAVELKELNARFAVASTTFDRLAPTITELEQSLLEAKKEELEKTLKLLDEEADTAKSKEFLRLCKVILDDFTSAINEKEKEGRQATGSRLTEFKALSSRLEALKLTVSSRLSSILSEEEKTKLVNELKEIENRAKKFGDHEKEKNAAGAREVLIVFKSNLEDISETIDDRLASLKTAKTEQREKENKDQEAKRAFAKEFTDAKKFFGKLKDELGTLTLSGEEGVAFGRRTAELEDLSKAFEAETDVKRKKDMLVLFKAILGEFSTFVIQKFRNNPAKKSELEEAYKTFNKGSDKRPPVMRPTKPGQMITLTGTRDPLTGEPKKVTVEEWKAKQKADADEKERLAIERKQKSERELKETHEQMFKRDPEGYKKLYVGRVWSNENELTKKVVSDLLEEKATAIDGKVSAAEEQLWKLEAEVDRRNELVGLAAGRDLTDEESEEVAALDEKILPFVQEIESLEQERKTLTELPYEEQIRAIRETRSKDAQNNSLRNWTFSYNPALDKNMDWIGFDNRELTRDERKRFIKASYSRRVDALREAREKIPGFTKTADNARVNDSLWSGKKVDPTTKTDLGSDNEKLASVSFGKEVKIGTPEGARGSDGMIRSIMREDAPINTDSKILKEVNKGAFERSAQAIEATRGPVTQPITQEDLERRMSKVGAVLEGVSKFAKNNWRAFLVGAGFGAAGLASAATTMDPSRIATTLEQVVSWGDFVSQLDPRQAAGMNQFIKDLTGK